MTLRRLHVRATPRRNPRLARAAAFACALVAADALAFPHIMEIPALRPIEVPALRAPEIPARVVPEARHDLAPARDPEPDAAWRPAPVTATVALPQQTPSQTPPSTDVRDPHGARISAVGFIVTGDGVVVASHAAISRCARIDALVDHRRVPAELLAHEGDITLLRIAGGPFVRLLPRSSAAVPATEVTLLGVHDSHWKVAAGDVLPTGANADDQGWPQVRTRADMAPAEGAVWAADGGVAGIAIDIGLRRDAYSSMLRLVPAQFLQGVLERHGIAWKADGGFARPDLDAAMRRALAATVPLACS